MSLLTIPAVFCSGGFAVTAGYLALSPEPAMYAVGGFIAASILSCFVGAVAMIADAEQPDEKYKAQFYKGGAL